MVSVESTTTTRCVKSKERTADSCGVDTEALTCSRRSPAWTSQLFSLGRREFAVVSLGNESLSYVALWLVEGANKAASFELVKGLPV